MPHHANKNAVGLPAHAKFVFVARSREFSSNANTQSFSMHYGITALHHVMTLSSVSIHFLHRFAIEVFVVPQYQHTCYVHCRPKQARSPYPRSLPPWCRSIVTSSPSMSRASCCALSKLRRLSSGRHVRVCALFVCVRCLCLRMCMCARCMLCMRVCVSVSVFTTTTPSIVIVFVNATCNLEVITTNLD